MQKSTNHNDAQGTRNKPPHQQLTSIDLLITEPWTDFELLDSGHGRKLERYGPYTVIRPEEQALWKPALGKKEWDRADAIFEPGKGNDDERSGRWIFPTPLSDGWTMKYKAIICEGRFTSFRHVGMFAEQASHWLWMRGRIKAAREKMTVLNLFGYTGIASLVAAEAGAHVTHVDASKNAIRWARNNQALSGLEDKPIRWICDDAMKFLAREVRRGNSYDIILMDPPKYGRGPKGETWNFFEDLPEALGHVSKLLGPNADSLVLTSYAIRASALAIDGLVKESFAKRPGAIETGELAVRETSANRLLPTSQYTRWFA